MPALPGADTCLAALDATWPPARAWRAGAFTLRDGAGGGKRVSAATAEAAVSAADIDRAEAAQHAEGQRPLFRLRPGLCPWDTALDAALAGRGYARLDPTLILAAPVARLCAAEPAGLRYFPVWPPLEIQRQIWADAGIGPARQAIMARATGAKTALLARIADRAAGVAFVACHGPLAMLHAMEVAPGLRRKGAARNLMHGAASWAAAQGAGWLTLAVTEANATARALYGSLGMEPVTGYHYREAPAA